MCIVFVVMSSRGPPYSFVVDNKNKNGTNLETNHEFDVKSREMHKEGGSRLHKQAWGDVKQGHFRAFVCGN